MRKREFTQRVIPPSFNTWLRPTTLLACDNGAWRIGVPDEVFTTWIETNYGALLDEVICHETGASPRVTYEVRA